MVVVVHRVTLREHQILVLVQEYRILVSVQERQTRVLVCCTPVLELADTCELAPERNPVPFPVREKARLLDLVVEHMSEVELARELLRTLVSAVPLENRCRRVTGLEEEERNRADRFLVLDGVPKWQLQQPHQLFEGNQAVVGTLPVQAQSCAGSQEELAPEARVLDPEQTMLLAHRLVVLGRRSPQTRVHILQGLDPHLADMQMEEDPALQHSAVGAVVLGRKEVVLLLLLDRRICD